jgi:PAS domain S-box-containing protein
MIAMVVRPKLGQPYLFGLHQCSSPRVWSATEERLFQEIGRRLTDALTSVLIFRSLRDSERRLEEAQRIAHVGYWDRDLVAGRIALSDEGARIFGLQPEERVADLTVWHERWQTVIHPEDRPRAAAAAAAALAGGPRYEVEYRVVHRTGEVRIVHSQGDVIRDESGRPVRMFGIMQDITERKRAEAELRASEERFRTLVQFSFDVYWETDAQHRFTRQEFAESLADAPAPGSEIGKTRWEVPYLEPDEEAWRNHRATLDAHLPFRDFELARPAPDGGKRYVSVSGLPVFDETGRFIGYRGVGRHITDRKRSEEALRQSQAYLAEAQRLSHTGSWAFDVASNEYVYASEECLRIFELDAHEDSRTREAVSRLIHPEDWPRVNEAFEKSVHEKVDTSSEFKIRLPSGTVKHVHVIRHPVLNDAGDVVQVVGSVIDITERKRAEEERRESTERFRAIADYTYDWEYWIGVDGKLLWVNPAVERITGYSVGECLVMADFPIAIVAEADREAVAHEMRAAVQGSSRNDFEFRVRQKDGRLVWVAASWQPIYDSRGARLGHRSSIRDIAERKRAEDAVRESETRFRTFVDHAADAFFMLDFEQGTIVDVNRCACESLGYTREELIGASPAGFHLESDRAQMESLAGRAAAGGTVLDTHRHRRKDGSVFPVEVQASLFWHGGRRYLLKVARDISDRVRAEEQRDRLRQVEAELAHIHRVSMLGQLAASIAHEINQPLGAVVNSASASLRWLAAEKPEEARRSIARVIAEGHRASEIIGRIRAMIRKTPSHTERFDLNEAIREVLALARSNVQAGGVSLHTRLGQDLPPILGDRIQLEQVLLNLIKNAMEAMGAVGEGPRELWVSSEQVEPTEVLVAVRDSGPGLGPQDLDRLFEAFYTTKPHGLGMGLAISRSIIEAHGGRLWATPNSGPGTTFQFTLPTGGEKDT